MDTAAMTSSQIRANRPLLAFATPDDGAQVQIDVDFYPDALWNRSNSEPRAVVGSSHSGVFSAQNHPAEYLFKRIPFK
jgi:hypothetical protein